MPFWEVNSPVQHSTMNMNCAEQLPFSDIGFVDCSPCATPDTTLDTVRCQEEDNIDRVQTYFNLAVFKRQDEEKETPSTSIALNRSTGLKKYYSSFA
eukprot:IDg23429t1